MGRKLKSRVNAPPYAEPPTKSDRDALDIVQQSVCSGDVSALDEYFGSDIGSTRIASVLKALILYLSQEKVQLFFSFNDTSTDWSLER